MKYFKLAFIPFLLLLTSCLDNSSSSYDDTEDQAFLEEYAQREGVVTTNSGLMYRVIEEGEGTSPASDQHAIITYEAEDVNQTDVFSTGNTFVIIVPDNVLSFSGIAEGVQLMKEGGHYEFVLPPDLAVNNGRVYIFDLQLESVIRENQEQFLIDNAGLEDIVVTNSGLQYRVIEEGEGTIPESSSRVRVNYKGTYTNGYVFDESPSGETVEFTVSRVIPGFAEGLQQMKEGAKYELFLPPDLGYGNNPPQYGTVLRFEVELVEVL